MLEWLSWLEAAYEDEIEITLRLLVAALAGMAVGLNRDIHNKPIGMRTLGLVALGSDQAPGNNCNNIFNEMKLTALFNKIKYRNPTVMPAWEVLRMATIEGAQAIGLGDQVGSLEPGKQADLILVDLTAPNLSPVLVSGILLSKYKLA